MTRVERFRNSIMEASGRIRKILMIEYGNTYYGFGPRYYSRPHEYVLGWFRHPDPEKKSHEVTYQPNWGVKCVSLIKGSNGAAHDVAVMVPEGYEWEENQCPMDEK